MLVMFFDLVKKQRVTFFCVGVFDFVKNKDFVFDFFLFFLKKKRLKTLSFS